MGEDVTGRDTMITEEILKLIGSNKDSFVQIIKAKYKDFYEQIKVEYTGKSFSEKLYRFLYKDNLSIGKCELCNKTVGFRSFVVGFAKFCSAKCANVSSAPSRSVTKPINWDFWEEKSCKQCGNVFKSLKLRDQLYCSNRCSCKVTSNEPERLKKIRKTKLERYGDATYVNSEKAKQTCLIKYGVDNSSKFPEIINRIKQSNQKHYGVDWSWQANEVKNHIKETCQKKYGVDNISQSSVIKDRKIKAYYLKYGVNNPFQSDEIMQKVRAQYKQKFGVEYPSQIEDVRKKASETVRKTRYKFLYDLQRGLSKVDLLFSEDEFIDLSYQHRYKVRCQKCGNIFDDHFDGNGHPRCLVCFPNIAGYSYAEKEILDYIQHLIPMENVISRDRSLLKNLELDIYVPSFKIAIEYDGLFWHSEMGGGKNKLYHLNKMERCHMNGIQLITIFEDEWNNKKEIVKNKLHHLFCKSVNKLYARKCKIEEITGKHSTIFLEKYHIQGRCPSKVNVGLFYNNELISVMTFGSPRIIMGHSAIDTDEYELLRYASAGLVVGGASKMLSYFIRNYHPKKIISFADRRWSMGSLYEKMGFTNKQIIIPSFWYFKPGYAVRYHKFGFRKSILSKKVPIFVPALTEWENMQLNGWDRIWDCGNLKYEWIFSK